MCNIKNHINNFYAKYSKCTDWNCKIGLKRYNENKNMISIQRKIFPEKNTDRLLQRPNDRKIRFKEIVRTYVGLGNRLKALEESLKIVSQYMSQKIITVFIDEIYSKGLKQNYISNKIDVYHIDVNCSLDILDLKDYGRENNRGYRCFLVVIDNISKFVWTVPLKIKNSQTKLDTFENFVTSWKRSPTLIETNRGKIFQMYFWKVFFKGIFQMFPNNNNTEHYYGNTSLGAVFAERFNRTIRDLLKRPVFQKGYGSWVDALPTIIKQNI